MEYEVCNALRLYILKKNQWSLKIKKKECLYEALARMWSTWNSHTLMEEMLTATTNLKNILIS